MTNPADEFWLFCIILIIFIIISVAGVVYFSMKLLRNNYGTDRVLADREDMKIFTQRAYVRPKGTRPSGPRVKLDNANCPNTPRSSLNDRYGDQ